MLLVFILRSADCTHRGGEGFTLSAKVMPPLWARWRMVWDASLAVLAGEPGSVGERLRCCFACDEGRNRMPGASVAMGEREVRVLELVAWVDGVGREG
jgi:hypothetical protein